MENAMFYIHNSFFCYQLTLHLRLELAKDALNIFFPECTTLRYR